MLPKIRVYFNDSQILHIIDHNISQIGINFLFCPSKTFMNIITIVIKQRTLWQQILQIMYLKIKDTSLNKILAAL